MTRTLLLATALAFFCKAALAGMPTEETVTCPVGGEEFTVVGTLSCSTMGRTMSFKPVSSCDFVTRLPICPSNGLPLYQEFSDQQVDRLEGLLDSEEYQEIAALSPWRRAYRISVFLEGSGTPTGFNLLLNGYWYDEAFLGEAEALDDLLAEAATERSRAPAADRPFLDAILAYALFRAGRTQDAEAMLNTARSATDIPDFLDAYIDRIEACVANPEADGCAPDAPLDF